MPSFDGATGWLNSEPLTPEGLRGRVVARRLLDLHLRQLAAHPAVRPGLGRRSTRDHGPDRHRRPHAGVRLRARRRERPRPGARPAAWSTRSRSTTTTASGRAFANHFWPAVYLADAGGTDPLPPLRRGRVRDDRDGHPAAAHRRRRRRHRPGPGLGRAATAWRSPPTGRRCARPRPTSGMARARASPRRTSPRFDEPHAYELPRAATQPVGRCPGPGRSLATPGCRERAAAGGSRSGSTHATSTW